MRYLRTGRDVEMRDLLASARFAVQRDCNLRPIGGLHEDHAGAVQRRHFLELHDWAVTMPWLVYAAAIGGHKSKH